MPMTDKRKQYLAEYRKEHLRRVALDVSPEMYEAIKECAAEQGKPVGTFIKWLLASYIKHRQQKGELPKVEVE